MALSNLHRLFGFAPRRATASRSGRPLRGCRPQVEQLEDRCLLSGTPALDLIGPRLLGDAHDVLRPHVRKAADPRTPQVLAVYRKFLHRRPTAGELRKALRSLGSAAAVEQLEARLL